jgi:hypothetical protein
MNNKYAEYIKKLKSQQSTTTTLIIVCCCFSCILFIGLGVFGYNQKDFLIKIINKIRQKDDDDDEDTKKEKEKVIIDKKPVVETKKVDIKLCIADSKQSSECNYNECKNNKCICKGNYTGDNCEIDLCEYKGNEIDCKNGVCIKGNCKCNEGFSLETDRDKNSNTYGKKICIKDLCKGTGINKDNKCGQLDTPPRGVCNINGSCKCNNDWFGGVCEQNNCMIRKNNKFINKCYGVDQGITSCSNITGKCICNCSAIDSNGNCTQKINTNYTGQLCKNNLCLTSDGRPKCGIDGLCKKMGTDEIRCECSEGYTPSICNRSNQQCCSTYECEGCKHGKCKKVIQSSFNYDYYNPNTKSIQREIKTSGEYHCECNGNWMGRNCDINNCLVKNEEGNYKINPLTNDYIKKCDSDNVNRSKCVLNPTTKEFKECKCINNWSKEDNASPDMDCLNCLGGGDGYICPSNECNQENYFQYKDTVNKKCIVNSCIPPNGCKIGAKGNDGNIINNELYINNKKYPIHTRCRINSIEQCKVNECKKGFYYVDKIEVTNQENFSNSNTSPSPIPSNQNTNNNIVKHTINKKEFKYGVCLENKCICPNGNPTIGVDCEKHNQLGCKKDSICNSGFYKYYNSEIDRLKNNYRCISYNQCLMNRDRKLNINDMSYPDYLFTLEEIKEWLEQNPSRTDDRTINNHIYSPNIIRNNIECVNKKRDNS